LQETADRGSVRPLIKLTNRFAATVIEDEIIITRIDNGEFFALSETAAAAWNLIDGTRDSEALLQALASHYEVDEATIAQDVGDLLVKLRLAGLLEEA
jgi:hypothetical protein